MSALAFPKKFAFKFTTEPDPEFPWDFVWFVVACFCLGVAIAAMCG